MKVPPLLPPLCGFIEGLGQKAIVRDQIQQKPAVPKNSLICQWDLGTGMEQTAHFLSGLSQGYLSVFW
jgi:hypothetical protein